MRLRPAVPAACAGAPSRPGEPLSGRFVLRSADGAPLPYPLATASGESYTLLAETTTLKAEYRRSGTRVEVGFFRPCPPNAVCLANDVGTVDEGRLVLASWKYQNRPGTPPRLAYTRQ